VVLWFGFGLLPKILLVALVTFFPMMVALVEGYAATEKEIAQMLAAMGAGRWRIFWLARLPSALPYFFAGLRISITYAVVGAIFAEYAGAAKGLGIYMLSAKNNFRPGACGGRRQLGAHARFVRPRRAGAAPRHALGKGGARP